MGGEKEAKSNLTHPPLSELLEAAKHHVMTPEEKEAQRQSWVRGEMAMGDEGTRVFPPSGADSVAREPMPVPAEGRVGDMPGHKHCIFCGTQVPVPRPTTWSLECFSPLNTMRPDTFGRRYHAVIVGSAKNEPKERALAASSPAPGECRNPNHANTDGSVCPHEIGPSCMAEMTGSEKTLAAALKTSEAELREMTNNARMLEETIRILRTEIGMLRGGSPSPQPQVIPDIPQAAIDAVRAHERIMEDMTGAGELRPRGNGTPEPRHDYLQDLTDPNHITDDCQVCGQPREAEIHSKGVKCPCCGYPHCGHNHGTRQEEP